LGRNTGSTNKMRKNVLICSTLAAIALSLPDHSSGNEKSIASIVHVEDAKSRQQSLDLFKADLNMLLWRVKKLDNHSISDEGLYNHDKNLGDLVKRYVKSEKISPNKLIKTIVVEKIKGRLRVYVDRPRKVHKISVNGNKELELFLSAPTIYGTLLKEYSVSVGPNPLQDKKIRGDKNTPEGEFYIAKKFDSRKYHKALYLSYPSITSADEGLISGVISKSQYASILRDHKKCTVPNPRTKLGDFIEIHGGGGGRGYSRWTDGCVAMKNPAMDEISDFADVGCSKGKYRTKVVIKK